MMPQQPFNGYVELPSENLSMLKNQTSKLGTAYDTLRDEELRREYDLIYPTITPGRPSPQTTQTPRPPPGAERETRERIRKQQQEAQEKFWWEATEERVAEERAAAERATEERAAEERAAEEREAEEREAAERAAEQQRQEEQATIFQQNLNAATIAFQRGLYTHAYPSSMYLPNLNIHTYARYPPSLFSLSGGGAAFGATTMYQQQNLGARFEALPDLHTHAYPPFPFSLGVAAFGGASTMYQQQDLGAGFGGPPELPTPQSSYPPLYFGGGSPLGVPASSICVHAGLWLVVPVPGPDLCPRCSQIQFDLLQCQRCAMTACSICRDTVAPCRY